MSAAAKYRKIIHVDMDAFFASVEQRDHPELRGKPIAVGGDKQRGVVAAASYEARAYGVKSAMPSKIAAQKCPHLIFVKHRFEVYREVSHQIRAIFHEYTDQVEPLSLDEAYLDVTENKLNIESAILVARQIKEKIKATTQLNASAGVSINKFLAKVASDVHKPDGLTVILPEQVEAFLEELPVEKFFGVGKKMTDRLHRRHIHTGADLKQYSKIELASIYGKAGTYMYNMVRGIDNRPVNPDRIRKSISSETTFERDLKTLEQVQTELDKLTEKLAKSLDKKQIMGKTLNIKLKYSDFTIITRSRTLGSYFNEEDVMKQLTRDILSTFADIPPVRLVGVGLSNLNTEHIGHQLIMKFPK